MKDAVRECEASAYSTLPFASAGHKGESKIIWTKRARVPGWWLPRACLTDNRFGIHVLTKVAWLLSAPTPRTTNESLSRGIDQC